MLRGRRKNSTSPLRGSGFGHACAVPAQNALNTALTMPDFGAHEPQGLFVEVVGRGLAGGAGKAGAGGLGAYSYPQDLSANRPS